MATVRVRLARYKLLSLFLASLLLAIFLAENDWFHQFLVDLGEFEYLGAFLAGILFVSTFTVATSAVLIAILANDLNPFLIALIGGVGAVIGDLIVFKIFKNHINEEMMLVFGKEGGAYVKHVLRSKYIAWTLPLIGAFIIASPLPDEIGISILGLAKISETKLVLISFFSNAFGILAIASVAKLI